MIQPLRRRHFYVWLALAAALPLLLAVSLASRREPAPPNPSLHWERYR